ncbi:MAG: hypothetical protein ACKVOH_04710, partial [Chlamydiales bacterium]
FKMAASMAFKDGMRKANPILLEPMMAVEVETPENFVGNVIGDFIFNRDLERRENEHNVGNIETTRIITNAGIVVLNVIDWFEFFAVLGTTTVTIETPSYTGDFDSLLEFSPRFSWSLGVSAVVWRYGDFLWGWRGQYFRTQPKPNSYYDLGGGVATYFNDVKTATYYDWTVATGISYEFQTSENTQLIPHISLTAAGAKLGMRGLSFTNNGVFHKILNMKTKKMWGYGLGATFGLGHRIAMTIEGRFADGCAMFVGGEFKL